MNKEIQELYLDFKKSKNYNWPKLLDSQEYFIKENPLCGDKVYLWELKNKLTQCKPCGCQILFYSCIYLHKSLNSSSENVETFIKQYPSFKKELLSSTMEVKYYPFLEKRFQIMILRVQKYIPIRIPCILLPWDTYLSYLTKKS